MFLSPPGLVQVDGKGITKQSDLGCLMWFGIEVALVVKGKFLG